MHWWWKLSNLFKWRQSGVQHSLPYKRVDSTHAWYTWCLDLTDRWWSENADWQSIPKAFEALSILLSTSASIFPSSTMTDSKIIGKLTNPLNQVIYNSKGLLFISRNWRTHYHKLCHCQTKGTCYFNILPYSNTCSFSWMSKEHHIISKLTLILIVQIH